MALPQPQVGDLIAFTLVYNLDDQICMNTFHYTVGTRTAGPNGPTVADVAQFIGDDLWDDAAHGLCNGVSQDLVLNSYVAQIIKPTRTIAATAQPTVNGQGLIISAAAPTGVSVVVQRKGTTANRHNQGRIYIPGIAVADITASALVVGSPTDNAIAAFLARLPLNQTVVTGGITLTLVPVLCPLPAGTPLVIIQQASHDQTIRYQRRRELRVGI